jgi:hypothetical protein
MCFPTFIGSNLRTNGGHKSLAHARSKQCLCYRHENDDAATRQRNVRYRLAIPKTSSKNQSALFIADN